MKKYDVVIRAVVTKMYTVEAADAEAATEAAHQIFSTEQDGVEEHYSQDTLSVEVSK